MKNEKYKEYNDGNYKRNLIVLLIVLFIFFILASIMQDILNKNEFEIQYDNITTIKQMIEFYKSTYISEVIDEKAEFYTDVNMIFRYLPYDEEEHSNEDYYTRLIEDCAKILGYKNYKLSDSKNNINVQVICDNNAVSKIIINGIEDYFIYMDSQISLKTYKEIQITNFEISAEVLNRCIENSWKSDTYIGERTSIYNNYYIYANEGIEVRSIYGRIYNIVFTKKYNGNVVNNLFPGIDLNNVTINMGKPSFENKEFGVIGYKGEKMYVFFSEDEISVYRVGDADSNDFFKLSDDFIDKKIDFLEFMNKLTYLWPDYSVYDYSDSHVLISYPLKGVEISVNNDDINGILLYNNIKSNLSKVSRYLEDTNFVSRLKVDLVSEAENRRIENKKELLEKSIAFEKEVDEDSLSIIGKSANYYLYPAKDANGFIYKLFFISKSNEKVNRELNDAISYCIWISDDCLVYSKDSTGIYSYNLNDGVVKRLVSGKDKYILKGFENGILKYDDTEIQVIF